MNNVNQEIDKEVSKNHKSDIKYQVKFSFNITYILLLTTATITFIEAIRTQNATIRHVLNLETAISVIAAYFYSSFIAKINNAYDNDKMIDWNDINKTRYVDWFITTPLMLLTLSIVLSNEINTSIKLSVIASIISLNYLMLYLGYLGETDKIDKKIGMITGFIAFALMYFIIYYNYVRPRYKLSNYILFFFYLLIWSIYGIVYMLDEDKKNISFNILDLIAKCLIGLGLWAYYTKIIILG